MFRVAIVLVIVSWCCSPVKVAAEKEPLKFFAAADKRVQYMGRIDFSDPTRPRFWQPGVTTELLFSGSRCGVIIGDQVQWGVQHNYIELVLDGKSERRRLQGAVDTIWVTPERKVEWHKLEVIKNTEANIGYIEMVGFLAKDLGAPDPLPARKIEFIGNSITCGTGSDVSAVPCGKGRWEDQHNAYMSYGAQTARSLNAQYHLSSVSGIGLMRSCCDMNVTMPKVFDKVDMRKDSIAWDFSRWQPDVVSICLGQNDGIQDSAIFLKNYATFIHEIRKYYPGARLIAVTSPMADEKLADWMRKMLGAIRLELQKQGELNFSIFAFTRSYNSGCDQHPDIREHGIIAEELTSFIRKEMHW